MILQDEAYEEDDLDTCGNIPHHIRKHKRICLVLDCLCAHDFDTKTANLVNLQHYVIKEKKLCEKEALVIFCDVVRVVESLHRVWAVILISNITLVYLLCIS